MPGMAQTCMYLQCTSPDIARTHNMRVHCTTCQQRHIYVQLRRLLSGAIVTVVQESGDGLTPVTVALGPAHRTLARTESLEHVAPKHHCRCCADNYGESVPLFIAGSSMGALFAAIACLEEQSWFSGLLLWSPALDVEKTPVLQLQSMLGGPLEAIMPRARIVAAVRVEDMSDDPQARHQHNPCLQTLSRGQSSGRSESVSGCADHHHAARRCRRRGLRTWLEPPLPALCLRMGHARAPPGRLPHACRPALDADDLAVINGMRLRTVVDAACWLRARRLRCRSRRSMWRTLRTLSGPCGCGQPARSRRP